MSLAPWLLAAAASTAGFTTPHLATTPPPHAVQFDGRTYVDHGLVAAGRVPAGTLDFMGDTLGSFSSLGVQAAQWRRTRDGYEGVLWTLPDRGRNDPDAGLFYDYAGRLERLRMTLRLPRAGQTAGETLTLVPDGGLTLRDFEGQPFTGADPGAHTVVQGGFTLPSPPADRAPARSRSMPSRCSSPPTGTSTSATSTRPTSITSIRPGACAG